MTTEIVTAVVVTGTGSADQTSAQMLDTRINERMRLAAKDLAQAYLEVASLLKQMHDTGGFKTLEGGIYTTWGAYLGSKEAYGRTYLSYLWKLAQAGDLTRFVEAGISGSKLVEVAKHTDFPDRIPELLDETIKDIGPLSVREAAKHVRAHVEARADHYKRPKKASRRGRPRMALHVHLSRQYESLASDHERQVFMDQIKTFLRAHDV